MDEQTQANIPPKATPTPPVTAPGVPRPITVRLRPIAPPSSTPSAMSPITPTTAGDAATVRLRPIAPSPSMTAPIMAPTPTVTASTSSQAAKSKTSRISLDSAVGVAASVPITSASADQNVPKTIRLKRPTDLESPTTPPSVPIGTAKLNSSMTAAIIPPSGGKPGVSASPSKTSTIPSHKTSRIPDSVIPTESALTNTAPTPAPAPTADSSTVTQKKTLKIRRPGAPESTTATPASAEGADASLEGVALTPISEIEVPSMSQGYKVFSVFAITFASIAAILMIVLNWCLAADAIAPFANKNTAASIQLDAQLPWPQKFIE